MNSSPNDQAHVEPVADAARKSAERRRRLMLGGASAPLLMTIASRPSWAGGDICTRSALASANLSGRHTYEGCSRSASSWAADAPSTWPDELAEDLAFNAYFRMPSNANSPALNFVSLPLSTVLAGESELGKNAVAALLNAYAYPSSFGTEGFFYAPQDVLDLFARNAGSGSGRMQLTNAFQSANDKFDTTTAWTK